MKTPTPIALDSTPSCPARSPRRLPLLVALALACGGATLDPARGHSETQSPSVQVEPGTAQSDTAHQLAEKLSSLNGVVRVGLGLFVCGLLSLSYPPVRARFRSLNTRMALLLGGLALMVLPTFIVGNELLVLGALLLVGGGWFLAQQGRAHTKRKA